MTQTPQTMYAAAIDQFGGPEALTPHTLPLPELADDEILIRVASAGVGVWDPFEREGGFARMMGETPHFPYVLGSDGAGTVVAVGQNVRSFHPGDPVYAYNFMNPKGGFYAEYTCAKAENASHIPSQLTLEEAGAMAVDAMTALRGLDNTLQVQPGELLLILGASGGIGHLAVQLAKRMGARVLAVASGDDGLKLVKSLGADAAIDGHLSDIGKAAKEFAPGGLDCALLTAGGSAAQRVVDSLRNGGRAAYPNGVEPAPKPRAGITLSGYDGTPSAQAIQKLNTLIEQGPFHVHIARTFPLSQAAEAHRALGEHYLGKLVLRPS